MADEEHLSILNQGVEVWNSWRADNPHITPDLSKTDLKGENLSGINLERADLHAADLSAKEIEISNQGRTKCLPTILTGANLSFAKLSRANLGRALLAGADLYEADLDGSNLFAVDARGANCTGAFFSSVDMTAAKFSNAVLREAGFIFANLTHTDLTSADLTRASFDQAIINTAILNRAKLKKARLSSTLIHWTKLEDADFSFVQMGFGTLSFCDLSRIRGLDTIVHFGPTEIDLSTLTLTEANVSEKFLLGCGLGDWEIEYAKLYIPDLSVEEITNILYRIHDLRSQQGILIKYLFISYSHNDSSFVDKIVTHFNQQGIRYFRDIYHFKAGKLETQIDHAIEICGIVLLVLSEHSVNSDWVEHEARKAREKEKKTGINALCPVALDDSWKTCRWPERLREQIMEYNILDFSKWNESDQFDNMFAKLIDGLAIFYK